MLDLVISDHTAKIILNFVFLLILLLIGMGIAIVIFFAKGSHETKKP